MPDSAVRLWDVDHPYYCSESNYFSNDCHVEYASWPEFLESEGDNDLDMNLVFRWDWNPVEYVERDDAEQMAAFHSRYDDNYRAYVLLIFWMGQRKGLFRCTQVSVCRADEPSAREWLTVRAEHMRLLWEPLLGTPSQGDTTPDASGSGNSAQVPS